ncbi:MAG: pilus assembly protein PilP [Pseudomonadota bacterium]
MKRRLPLLTIVLAFLMAGCADPDLDELSTRMEEVEGEAEGDVPPLPSLAERDPPAFLDDGRNPMAPPERARAGDDRPRGPSPEPDREPDPLEAYSLENLRLVGTMGSGQRRVALVAGPEGRLHQVAEGDYMGRDHGRVERITTGAIELRELVEAGGGWQERTTTIKRGDQES